MLCPEVREECSIAAAATPTRTAGLVHWGLCGAWRAELTDSRVGLRGLGRDGAAVVRGGAGAVGRAAARAHRAASCGSSSPLAPHP
eukprot:3283047-Rhodomonas_salina.1